MNKPAAVAAIGTAITLPILLVAIPLLALIAMMGGSSNSGGGCGGGAGLNQPGGAAVGATAPQDLPAASRANAATIIHVGQSMQVPPQGIIVALATSSRESGGFKNYANDGTDPRLTPDQKDVVQSLQLPHDAVGHDHGSIGIFQQQFPIWGTVAELMDPATAARKFYEALLKVRGWESMPVTVAAQTVQGSAFPDAYAAHEVVARQLYGELAGTAAATVPGAPAAADVALVACPANPANGPIGVVANGITVQLPAQAGVAGTLTFPTQAAATAATAGLSYLGTRYSWGGGSPAGPTVGIHDGGVADSFGDYDHPGFDCSGLMLYSYAQAGVFFGRDTNAEFAQVKTHVPWAQAQPGDLLFYGNPALTHHVAMYLGQVDGKQLMLEAPQSGDVVKVSTVRTGGDFLAGDAARPTTAPPGGVNA